MVKGNTWLWASVERSRAAWGSSIHTGQAGLGWEVAAQALCPVGCRACCSRSEHPPLAGTSSPAETGICSFPANKGRLVQSGFGWETSKLCCSEPVSSFPSFPGHGAPAHTWEIGLPRAERRRAESCLLFLLQVLPGHWEKGLFSFLQLCWPNPTSGKIREIGALEVAPCYQEDLFGTKSLEQNQESHPLLSYHID